MAKLSANEFLTVEELAKFLEKSNPAINSSIIFENKTNTFEIIKDFLRENAIIPVFYYEGIVQYCLYEKTHFGLIGSQITNQNGMFKGYLFSPSIMYESLLGKELQPQPLDGLYECYRIKFSTYDKPFNFCAIDGRDTITNKPNKFLTISELRFPKIHIEQLLKNKKLGTSLNKEAVTDSMYCLIAMLKGLLLDENIGAFHFRVDSEKSSNKPSQEGLIAYISEMKIQNLSTDNIRKTFPIANQTLKDAKSEETILASVTSAYCLIAILKNLLIDENLETSHFKAKNNNDSQEALILQYISKMNIKNLNIDTVEKLLQEADRILQEVKMK